LASCGAWVTALGDGDPEDAPSAAELRELYARPPGEFVAARNQVAARLGREGRRDAAAAVRRLPRPSPALWAVNRLARDAAAEVGELLDLGDRLRRAQSRVLAGDRGAADALRGLGAEQGRLLNRLRERAARLLVGGGHAASDDTLRRVETTLRSAAAADAGVRQAVVEGRLSAELAATGFVEVPILTVVARGEAIEEEVRARGSPDPGARREESGAEPPAGGEAGREEAGAGRAVAAELAERRARDQAAVRLRLRLAERELEVQQRAARRAGEAARRAADRVSSLEAQLAAAEEEAVRAGRDAAGAGERARQLEGVLAEARRALEETMSEGRGPEEAEGRPPSR
jgi:hypothetical protein